jgi:hypothetical protein
MPYSLQKIPLHLFQRNESIIKQLDSVLGRESVCYPICNLNSFRDIFLAAQHFIFSLHTEGGKPPSALSIKLHNHIVIWLGKTILPNPPLLKGVILI